MTTRTLTALYDRYDDAAAAVTKLEAAGVPHADVSLVGTRTDATPAATGDADGEAVTGAGAGATLGTILGGGAGLLAGLGLLAIPGIGPVVAAGWLVATLTGAGIGAAAGGLAGSLAGAGINERDAHAYAEGVRRGGTLLTVKADAAHADTTMSILEEHGAIDLDERAQGWERTGWVGVGTAEPTGLDSAVASGTPTPAAAVDGAVPGVEAPSSRGRRVRVYDHPV